jgi:phosphoenolpyruvate carboxykinase (GTP)
MPRIYTANWFRKDARNQFIWPGYGENMRVLKWIIERIEGVAGEGQTHALGTSPAYEDIDWTGLDFETSQFEQVMHLDAAAWVAELALHDELFTKLGDRLPLALAQTRTVWEQRLTISE